MEFTEFEKDWIIELVEEKYAEFEEEGHLLKSDKEAFESILNKLKQVD